MNESSAEPKFQKRPPSVCPPTDQLAQLVSGSLAETAADSLFAHLDGCTSCQRIADQLAQRHDPMLAAADGEPGETLSEFNSEHLQKMIRQAQAAPASQDTRSPHRSTTTQAVSPDAFVSGLRRSGLMDEAEVDKILSELSDDSNLSANNGSALAKQLIRHNKLTPFQAKLLLRGKWQGLVLGNYAILEKLGQGGMGSVFKARHTRMGRIVCLKVINSAGRQSAVVVERFQNEARALAALSHPNIVVAHDANESKGIPYLVMEYVDGDDLAKRIRSDGPMDVDSALQVAIQTAEALRYAHAEGITHRDIKPHNLVVTEDLASGELVVKVLDLGLARFDSLMTNNPDASVLAAMTNTGAVIGTVDYMAPEQALDSRDSDARSDIYSLGCTLYFLLSGGPPFDGETVMQRLVAHREQRPPSLCDLGTIDIPAGLDAVVQKMLAKNPDDRYSSMDDVLHDFSAILAGTEPSAATEVIAPPVVTLPPPLPSPVDALAVTGLDESEPLPFRSTEDAPPPVQSRRMVFPIGATAAILVAIAVVLIPTMMPRTGAAQAIRNGGEGRALAIVGSEKFDTNEFEQLAKTLGERNINLVVASPLYGTGKKEFGAQLREAHDNVNLSDAQADEFDAVFVLGGECHELTHKQPEVQKEVIRVIKAAMDKDIVLTGCSYGHHVIWDTQLPGKKEYKYKSILKAHSAQELSQHASNVFDQLQKSQD